MRTRHKARVSLTMLLMTSEYNND